MLVHIHAGDRRFSHAARGPAVAGDEAPETLEKAGIVPDTENALAIGILGQKLLEIRVTSIQSEGRTDFNFGVVPQLRAHELGGLQGALQRAGDDHVNRRFEGAQYARHQHALLFALLDEASLAVKDGIFANGSGIRMAHEIENHGDGCGGARGLAELLEGSF